MKTKKLTINIISLLTQSILDIRNASYHQANSRITVLLQKISKMHLNNMYNKEIYSILVDKLQYGIQQKLMLKEFRLLKEHTIMIHFKLISKETSIVTFIQSWQVSVRRPNKNTQINKINTDEELIYLLQQVLQAIRCQFLTQFNSTGKQIKSKYILDYEIQVNHKKRTKLNIFNYQHIWVKEAFIDQENIVKVTCFYNVDQYLQRLLTQIKSSNREQIQKIKDDKNIKRGSEQTKPSNSGEYELTSSLQDNTMGFQRRQRKTSVIEFYDEDLNITVLSNDSDSFKKSTGKILNQNILEGLNDDQEVDSEGEFELLYDEEFQKENMTEEKTNERLSIKLQQIESGFHFLIKELDVLFQVLSD